MSGRLKSSYLTYSSDNFSNPPIMLSDAIKKYCEEISYRLRILETQKLILQNIIIVIITRIILKCLLCAINELHWNSHSVSFLYRHNWCLHYETYFKININSYLYRIVRHQLFYATCLKVIVKARWSGMIFFSNNKRLLDLLTNLAEKTTWNFN